MKTSIRKYTRYTILIITLLLLISGIIAWFTTDDINELPLIAIISPISFIAFLFQSFSAPDYDNTDLYLIEVKFGFKHRFVSIEYKNGERYIGEVRFGQKYGHGKMIYTNGEVYIGAWKKYRNGYCKMLYENGDTFIGKYKYSSPSEGTMFFKNGDTLIGKWNVKKSSIEGTMKYTNGDIFVGKYRYRDYSTDQNYIWDSTGTMFFQNGDIKNSNWESYFMSEKGTIITKNGK